MNVVTQVFVDGIAIFEEREYYKIKKIYLCKTSVVVFTHLFTSDVKK